MVVEKLREAQPRSQNNSGAGASPTTLLVGALILYIILQSSADLTGHPTLLSLCKVSRPFNAQLSRI